jgi:cytochrome c2
MSNKKKQNSIDWLVEELRKYIEEPWKYVPKGGKEAIVAEAKAMHKEEIIKSWMATDNELQRISAEHYYNSTYGGDK